MDKKEIQKRVQETLKMVRLEGFEKRAIQNYQEDNASVLR